MRNRLRRGRGPILIQERERSGGLGAGLEPAPRNGRPPSNEGRRSGRPARGARRERPLFSRRACSPRFPHRGIHANVPRSHARWDGRRNEKRKPPCKRRGGQARRLNEEGRKPLAVVGRSQQRHQRDISWVAGRLRFFRKPAAASAGIRAAVFEPLGKTPRCASKQGRRRKRLPRAVCRIPGRPGRVLGPNGPGR